MRDDFLIPNLGEGPKEYDKKYIDRLVRNVEMTLRLVRSEGPINVTTINADSLDADAIVITGLGNGVVIHTGSGAYTARTITGTANKITVTNGDGVAGNPTITIPDAVTLVTPTITGLASFQGDITQDTNTDTATLGRVRITETGDISALDDTDFGLMIGPVSGQNLALDTNEIQSRNNGAVGTLLLNDFGGNINMFSNGSGTLTTAGEIISTVGNEALDLRSLNVGAGAVYIRFRDSAGTALGYIGFGSSSNDIYGIVRNVAGEIQLDPGSGGTFNLVRGQIQFPAAQNASSDVNTLDDYEEGTWTPTLTFGGASTGITYDSNEGVYIKIGQLVNVFWRIRLTSKGTATGSANITGLPFACGSFVSLGPYYTGIGAFYTGLSGMNSHPAGYVNRGATSIVLTDSAATARVNMNDTHFTDTSDILMSMTYRASA